MSDHVAGDERRAAQSGGEPQRMIEGFVTRVAAALVVHEQRAAAFPAAVANVQVRDRLALCEAGVHRVSWQAVKYG